MPWRRLTYGTGQNATGETRAEYSRRAEVLAGTNSILHSRAVKVVIPGPPYMILQGSPYSGWGPK